MSDVASKLLEYRQAVINETAAGEAVMASLEALKITAGGSTFIVDSQHYQIRKRKGKTYLCALAGPPRGRPKKIRIPGEAPKPRKPRAKKVVEAEVETVVETVV